MLSRLASLCFAVLVPVSATRCIDEQKRPADTVDTSIADSAPDQDPQDQTEPDTLVADTAPDPDAESCSEPGTTRCSADRVATEICNGGVWVRVPCAEGNICVLAGGAQCVASTGDAGCRDMLYCFLGCQIVFPDGGAQTEACLVDCFRSGTQQAQRELSDTTDCIDQNCHDEQGFDCLADRCSQDLADCYFDTEGDKGCGSIIECRLGCGDDPACHGACGSDATIEAQGDYAVLEICTFYACAAQDDNRDCAKQAALPAAVCGPYASECIGLLPNTPR